MIVHIRLDMDDELMHGFKQVTGERPTRKNIVTAVIRMVNGRFTGDTDHETPKKTKKQKFTLRGSR